LKSAALPVATAVGGVAVGVLGGVALNRKGQPKRKLLGASIPAIGSGAEKLASQIGQAATQLSRLANEVRAAREQAAKIAKAMS
jgi:outer membrane murein-binding lipoprotein Lpp